MACMPWFKVHAGWSTHEKVLTLCALLKDDRADVYVGRLWDYCAQRRGDGRVTGPAAAGLLEAAVRYSGPAGALAEAMVQAGLLERHEDGTLEVHDWVREQKAIAKKFETDRLRPNASAREKFNDGAAPRGAPPKPPGGFATGSAANPPKTPGWESREKRVEKSQVREAEETTSRVREDVATGQPPLPSAPRDSQLPAQRPPPAWMQADAAGGEPLPDGVQRVFRKTRGADYTWKSLDDTASRELLSLAGTGGAPEVLRRWGHGVRARYKQRCDTLADLVRRWDANAAPEQNGTGPPGKPAVRPLNAADYREGDVESL